MTYVTADSMDTTNMQVNATYYLAGQEPWNLNRQGYNIEEKGTDTNNYISDWSKWHGLYREIAELRSTIDTWSRWIIGNKLKFKNDAHKKIAERITGNGKDTIRRLLLNGKRTSKICGDAFLEQIRDRAKRLINLKPLDPETIRIVANKKNIITRYEQINFKDAEKKNVDVINTWQPDEIFHIVNDRIADEIHGIPEPEKLLRIIKWRHQSMDDIAVVYHRYVKPLLEIHANTDDDAEIAKLRTQYDNAVKYMENVIIPKSLIDKTERVSVPQYSTLDPLPWILLLRDYFVLSSGVPDIILGHSRETSLAAGKLNYLAYKEKIIQEQNDFEEDIKQQLGLEIEFEEPREIDIEMGNKEGTNLRTTANETMTKDKTKTQEAK